MPVVRELTDNHQSFAITGAVSRLTATRGSFWGQITPNGADRKVYFDRASFAHESDFDLIQLGQRVNFIEESDKINGTRAADILPAAAQPYTDFSRLSGR